MKKLLISSLVLCFSLGLVIAQDSNQDVVSRLHSNGLTKYSSANDFRPYDSITRGEAAKFIVEYAKLQNLAKIKTSSECIFSDTNSYDVSLVPYITEACEYGLFKGFNGNYMPTNLITKGEAITVTIRSIFGIQNEQGSPRYTEYYNKGNNFNLTLGNINSFELPINRITLGLWLKQSYENGSNNKLNQEPKVESTTSFQTITLTDSGTELTDKISLKKGLYRFSFTHNGERNFIVKLLNSDGKTIEYLVNEIGVVDSSLGVNIPADGDYYMNFDADGTWNATIDKDFARVSLAKNTITNTGNKFVGPFKLVKGLHKFSFTHNGERNFIVKLLNSDGKTIEYLVNEIGVVDSSLGVNIPADGDYYMNVDADGTWNISDI